MKKIHLIILVRLNYSKSNEEQQEECQEQRHRQQGHTRNIVSPPQPPTPIYQQHIQNGHISKIPVHIQNPRPPPNKFSPEYAAYIGVKPRAQASARVGLGGLMKN